MIIPELGIQNGIEEGERIANGPKKLNKDIFLRLLVTQMQYQNPLEPLKNTEFTSQLAQFASVDQLYDVNDQLELFINSQDLLNKANMASLIGKEIKAEGKALQLSEDRSVTINYELSKDAIEVTIDIYNSNGNIVRTIQEQEKGAGLNTLIWDGKDNLGNRLEPGEYIFSVTAMDMSGNDIDVSSNIIGRVTGIVFNKDIPYLLLGDQPVPLIDMVEIRE